MKKILFFLLFVNAIAFAQAPPQGISHRGTVYNTSGAIVANETVKIRISILDNSITGTSVYSETHTVTTNAQGQYSLNIGIIDATNVQNSTNAFNTINWGTYLKFLKVEIDIPTSPNVFPGTYPIVGTNQLMSVPYALYSEKSNNGVTMVNHINDLRANTTYVNNQVVFVKGYYSEGDGGDGFFIFKEDEVVPDTGGIYIKPNAITPETLPGRWVRQYAGPINVIYFGVVRALHMITYGPPSGQSNGERIQNAIDYVHNYNVGYSHGNPDEVLLNYLPQDMTIYFPSGPYWIDKKLTLYPEMNIKGDKGTRLVPTFGGIDEYLFEITTSLVERLNIENIEIDFSQSKKGLGGIHLKAVNDIIINAGGGSWISNFKNIKMVQPTGHGIFIEGEDNVDPVKGWNQYLHFEDLYIERKNLDKNNNCLRIEGANVNIAFESCFFQIPYTEKEATSDAGANVFITSSGVAPQFKPCQISFINCASGGGFAQGVYNSFIIENSENITLENCWFEDVEVAIDINNSKSINILNSRFANAAGLGGRNKPILPQFGTCIYTRNSTVNIERNYVLVSDPNNGQIENHLFIRAIGGNNTINAHNNSFSDIRLSETYGIVQETYISNIINYNTYPVNQQLSGIETGEKKVVVVKIGGNGNGSNIIDRINSSINAGETLFIRAENGDIKINEWDPISETHGRNIYLSGNGTRTITLKHGQGAYFIKMDGGNGIEKCSYQLVSITY